MQGFAHVRVGVLPPHADADEHVAKGDSLALHPPEPGLACTFLTHAFELHHGIHDGYLAPQPLVKSQETRSTGTFGALSTTTMLYACKARMDKLSSFQALLVLHAQFHVVGTFIN